MGEFVSLEITDNIGTIRLNRPKVNALNDQVTEELAAAARAAAADEVRAVVIYGGERVFAGGADINDMAEAGYAEMTARAARLHEAMNLLAGLGKPVVAAITGYALGGGLEVALAADFRVAGETARLGQPEILLGVIPGAGGTQRLPRLIGPARAKDLVFSSRMVGAAEALAIGLVDQVVPDAEVYSAAVDMVRRYAAAPGPATDVRRRGPAAPSAPPKPFIPNGVGAIWLCQCRTRLSGTAERGNHVNGIAGHCAKRRWAPYRECSAVRDSVGRGSAS